MYKRTQTQYLWQNSMLIAEICLSIFKGEAKSNRELINKHIDGYKMLSHPVMVYCNSALEQLAGLLTKRNEIKHGDIKNKLKEMSIAFRNKELSKHELILIKELSKWRNDDVHTHSFPDVVRCNSRYDETMMYESLDSQHEIKSYNCEEYFNFVMEFIHAVEDGISIKYPNDISKWIRNHGSGGPIS